MRKVENFVKNIETKEDLIKYYESIPEKKWTIDKFHTESYGAYCALGHIGANNNNSDEQEKAIFSKLKTILGFEKNRSRDSITVFIGRINDGENKEYQQPSLNREYLPF
jgi:predicted transcriptional regulator